MNNKGINGSGLAVLWGKSKETFATKKELQDAVKDIPSGGGSTGSGESLEYLTDEEIDEICSYSIENFLESIASEGVKF